VPTDSPIDAPNWDALRLHLAALRSERNLSYTELASRSGVGRATLVALESGKPRAARNPDAPQSRGTLATWYAVAQALEVDLGDLLRPLSD